MPRSPSNLRSILEFLHSLLCILALQVLIGLIAYSMTEKFPVLLGRSKGVFGVSLPQYVGFAIASNSAMRYLDVGNRHRSAEFGSRCEHSANGSVHKRLLYGPIIAMGILFVLLG